MNAHSVYITSVDGHALEAIMGPSFPSHVELSARWFFEKCALEMCKRVLRHNLSHHVVYCFSGDVFFGLGC